MSISVALCTYNGAKYLREQLDSIAGQTRLPDELVVCDDRSQDATLEILEEFGKKVSFSVAIYQNETNLGSTKNFEKAIRLCSGEIIALCDQDDAWKPHKLERLTDALEAHHEAGYAFSDAELADENLLPLGRYLWESVGFKGEFQESFIQGDQFNCLNKQHIVTGATMAFRADVGKLTMPFPTQGKWIHDGWIALLASAMGAVGIPISEPLIFYRQHAGQQIGAPKPFQKRRANRKPVTLRDKYLELKENSKYLFTQWEKTCSEKLEIKEALEQLVRNHPTEVLQHNLDYLREFETHFLSRRKILTSKQFGRYGLILREALSGRYGQFSDSWRSIFRDLFL